MYLPFILSVISLQRYQTCCRFFGCFSVFASLFFLLGCNERTNYNYNYTPYSPPSAQVESQIDPPGVTTIVRGLQNPSHLRTDSTYLYFFDTFESGDKEHLQRVRIADGVVETIVEDTWWVGGFLVNGESVYFTEREASKDPLGNSKYYIKAIKTTTREITVLVEQENGFGRIVTEGEHVYWVDEECVKAASGSTSLIAYSCTYKIKRVVISGGVPEILVSGVPSAGELVVYKGVLYWIDWGTADQDYQIKKMPVAGGPVETLASGLMGHHYSHSLFVSDSNIYWDERECVYSEQRHQRCETVIKTLNTQGQKKTIFRIRDRYGFYFTIDGDDLYWTHEKGVDDRGFSKIAIMKQSLLGGEAISLITDRIRILDFLVDKENIYWTEPDANSVVIRRRSK